MNSYLTNNYSFTLTMPGYNIITSRWLIIIVCLQHSGISYRMIKLRLKKRMGKKKQVKKRKLFISGLGQRQLLNGRHALCWKKGSADVDDWSYDNDGWCFLELFMVLLCCHWHWGVTLNARAHVRDLQWKPEGRQCRRDNPVTHKPSNLQQPA